MRLVCALKLTRLVSQAENDFLRLAGKRRTRHIHGPSCRPASVALHAFHDTLTGKMSHKESVQFSHYKSPGFLDAVFTTLLPSSYIGIRPVTSLTQQLHSFVAIFISPKGPVPIAFLLISTAVPKWSSQMSPFFFLSFGARCALTPPSIPSGSMMWTRVTGDWYTSDLRLRIHP